MEHFISLSSPALTLALAVLLPMVLLLWQQQRSGATGGASALAFAPLPAVSRSGVRHGSSCRGRRQGGFTLIELLICMVILCILAIIVGTAVYFTFFSGRVHISFT